MSVAFGAASAAQAFGPVTSSPSSWAHTAAGANRAGLVLIGWVTATQTSTAACTWGGTSMALLQLLSQVENGGAQANVAIFGLAGIPASAQTILPTLNGSNNYGDAISLSYTGVDQSTPFGTPVTSSFTGQVTDTLTFISSVGDMVVDVINLDTGFGPGSLTGTKTQRLVGTGNAVGYPTGIQDAAGASSVLMQWSWTNAIKGVHIGVNILQASGGGATSNPARRAFPFSILQH